MLGPTRIFLSLRHAGDSGLLAAIAYVSALFAATPFLIPVISEEFEVSLGHAGLLSTAQVGAFALVVFVAGRRFRTDRRLLIGSAAASVVLNILSAITPHYSVLLVVRTLAGAAAGVMVWLGWAKAMRLSGSMRSVAATGPLTVLVASPVIGWLADSSGSPAVFVLLGVVAVPGVFLPAEFARYRHVRRRMSPARSNVVLIVAMGVMTTSGSALFLYSATRGSAIGVASLFVPLAFSASALAGFIAARVFPKGGSGGIWVLGTGLCAMAVGFSNNAALFGIGLVMWGFCFWMATPRILESIAKWSLVPDERVGDTQSSMAVGRAIGPAIGGALIGSGTFTGVATFAVLGLAAAGFTVIVVSRYRRGATPPAEPEADSTADATPRGQ